MVGNPIFRKTNIQETENCIKVIENTITALQNKSDIIDTDLTKEKKWSYEEALVMSYNNTRNESKKLLTTMPISN